MERDGCKERKAGGEWGGPFSQDISLGEYRQLLLLIWYIFPPYSQYWTHFILLSKWDSYSWLTLKILRSLLKILRSSSWKELWDAYRTGMLGQKSRKIHILSLIFLPGTRVSVAWQEHFHGPSGNSLSFEPEVEGLEVELRGVGVNSYAQWLYLKGNWCAVCGENTLSYPAAPGWHFFGSSQES